MDALLLCLAAPLLTAEDPERQSLSRALRGPSWAHLLGMDHLGRDMLARILHGGRLSLVIGFLAVAIDFLAVAIDLAVGVPLGAISGFHGGRTNLVIQRFADMDVLRDALDPRAHGLLAKVPRARLYRVTPRRPAGCA
jgi:ABC-type dipeptide/oligopeptide/nickel transport system permease subunit